MYCAMYIVQCTCIIVRHICTVHVQCTCMIAKLYMMFGFVSWQSSQENERKEASVQHVQDSESKGGKGI